MHSTKPRIDWSVWGIDMVVLVIFAAIGRQSHNEANAPLAVLITAVPFMVAWSMTAWLSGVLVRQSVWRWIGLSALTSVVATLAGLGIRSIWLLRPIPLSFAVVSLIVTTAFLIGVRLAQYRLIPTEVTHD